MKELTTNIHLHLINNSYDLILNKYGIDREIYWRQKEGELHINLCFSAINLFLEKIYYILIVYILIYANMSGNLSNGSISAAYTNFEKLRSQFIDMKKQVETTVKKATPILLQKNIFEKNIKEVKFVENDCDKIMVENLSFKVEDQYILKDISLLLPLGKKIALIGENGSGKTSLLRCIAGINTSYTGNVKLLNEKYDLSSNKNKIMYATAQPKIFLDSSTYENIMMACESDPVSYVYGDVLDLKKYDEKEVECLSGGEKQRINLIRQLIASSVELYLLDEPTASLDKKVAKKVMNKFLELDKTVIYTTHDLDLAMQADIIIEMKKGEVIKVKNG